MTDRADQIRAVADALRTGAPIERGMNLADQMAAVRHHFELAAMLAEQSAADLDAAVGALYKADAQHQPAEPPVDPQVLAARLDAVAELAELGDFGVEHAYAVRD